MPQTPNTPKRFQLQERPFKSGFFTGLVYAGLVFFFILQFFLIFWAEIF